MSKLAKIHVILHRLGYDTKQCKKYTAKLKEELKMNWWANHRENYWIFYHRIEEIPGMTSKYDTLINEVPMTPYEAYIHCLND